MGRAPNSGAPGRVSAHVVPKSPSPVSDEEDEKTTLESGWEEEASTTVEQGEEAEKIRALAADAQRIRNTGTHVTSTNEHATVVEDHTVDEQHANAPISIITPQAVSARLVVTQGNDSGQAIEITPGKSYTIGRAIDNDVVLTDIAVSRKHFDLRHEDGSWIVADRGSGNGTVVNGNVEDQPFMLANGDTIEIGNTSFRFDHPNGFARAQPPQPATYDVALDEDEPSTVAGKFVRDDIITPAHLPAPHLQPKPGSPAPLPRARPVSAAPMAKAPASAYPAGSSGSMTAAMPSTVSPAHNLQVPAPGPYPHHAMAQLQQPLSAMAPMGQPMPVPRMALGSNQPTLLGVNHLPEAMQNGMPAPSHGPGRPMQPAQPMPFTYPSLNDPARPPHAPMMIVANHQRRDATSTALVPATPYAGIPMLSRPPAAYVSPQLSRRAKLILAATGLSLLAAIATIAIVKGSSSSHRKSQDPLIDEIKPSNPVVPPSDPTLESKAVKSEPKKLEPTIVEPKIAITDPSKSEPKKLEPTIAQPKALEPPVADPKKLDPKKPEPKKQEVTEPKKRLESTSAVADPPKVDPKADSKRIKRDPKKDHTPTPTRVATGGDADASKSKADGLYRQKKFNDAAGALRSSAKSLSGSEASSLLSLAATYEQFGHKYNVGMAGTTPPSQAWDLLKSAQSFDIGGAYKDEIQTKLQQIATKAALAFVGAKNYNRAVEAVRIAETTGSSSSTKIVRDALDSYAGELYVTASKEMGTSPDAARSKLKQIKGLVDAKSPWYQKATKLLNGSS